MNCQRTPSNILNIQLYNSNWCYNTCILRHSAERDVRTFKKYLIADLFTVGPRFPFYLWDRILTQVTLTLNMVRRYQLNTQLSAYEQVDGIHNFEQTPLVPLGCKVKIHKKIISESPMLPTQSMDGTLDQQSIIIDATSDIILILGLELHHI